ncbi:aldehyde dehydrogenase (NADP(+)) [Amphibiibacter pelophylacis]|uniref:Aldehyde dehydrogenase (NADP(+)) n=1 Tax=Amphibiibacter pelophylacis TaxID=1799477 RepID=A0ACC6P192_9BURK
MSTLTGQQLLGCECQDGLEPRFQAFNPATGQHFGPGFSQASAAQIATAAHMAEAAFDDYRQRPIQDRAAFLECIASNIDELGEELTLRAEVETALPAARLTGERGRTVGQLRLFARVLRDGDWQTLAVDPAQTQRAPAPRSDLRLRQIPLGPVAVFGASNFPLAFSVAGGDTASALAAGCPVVIKGHPAHPGTSELVGRAIQRAVRDCGMPTGVFSLLQGNGNGLGAALVQHPAIQAVGFTGSRQGGLALLNLAQSRPQPIPVYAEMSAINPVFMLPGALQHSADALGAAFVESLILGAGQFCTNPGVVLGLRGADWDRFCASAAQILNSKSAATQLTAGIHGAYVKGVSSLCSQDGVTVLAQGNDAEGSCQARPVLLLADAATFAGNPALSAEVFGPCSLLLTCEDVDEMLALARGLEGQLTATLHLQTPQDNALASRLLPILERKAGRILANGFPTGVEVCHTMVHGGPWPATSDSRSTSVGVRAINRFLRPVCYQDIPQDLLPESLRDVSLAHTTHLLDGTLKTAE